MTRSGTPTDDREDTHVGEQADDREETPENPHANEEILTAGAPAAAAEVALVLVHGRGATAQGVINLFEPTYTHGVTVIAPQGRRSRWFPERVSAPIEQNEPWLSSAVDRVDAGIEMARHIGIPADRTIIAGFSQGACVAAEFGVRHPREYGGLFVLSGTIPGAAIDDRAATGSLSGTPVHLACSDDDPYVSIDRVEASARVFDSIGGDVHTHLTTGAGHAVTEAGFDALADRVATLLYEYQS